MTLKTMGVKVKKKKSKNSAKASAGKPMRKTAERSPINVRWFKEKIAQAKTSQREIARIMGINQSIISHMFKGNRKMSLDEVSSWAKILGVPIHEVIANSGVDIPTDDLFLGVPSTVSSQKTVPLKGFVDSVLKIHLSGPGRGPATAPNPFSQEQSATGVICVRCQTAGGAFEGVDGALLYFREASPGALDFESLGRLCVVRVGGEHFLRILKRGYVGGRFNLALFNGQLAEESVLVESATPVLWMKM